MIYLLTRGWSLAHTSLAITPEHSDISAESLSTPAQKHMPRITQDSCATYSAAIKPAQSDRNGEYCPSNRLWLSTPAAHLITLSPRGTHGTDTPAPRQAHMPALFNGQYVGPPPELEYPVKWHCQRGHLNVMCKSASLAKDHRWYVRTLHSSRQRGLLSA